MKRRSPLLLMTLFGLLTTCTPMLSSAQRTQKPPLHGKHWMAITGKPLAATAGAQLFQQGGNAVDAACAMLAATCTMWDVLSWGGETQALIYHPKLKKVIAINALGVAPSGATVDFFRSKGYEFPPEYGPLAAVTPGTPGGLCYMLAHYGTKSLAEVLAPALEMAAGYPIDAQTATSIERGKDRIKEWPYSKKVFLVHEGKSWEAPEAGEVFVQQDLHKTLSKLVEAEKKALAAGKDRKAAIMAAYDRFYTGDIAGNTGVGMSQRLQSFVLDSLINPFNVVEPGKRPRVTLTPSMALKNGKPYLSFAVQGGDTQDQNLLQFFLNMVEFGMTPQQASEVANINSNQLWLSLGGTKTDDRKPRSGSLLLDKNTAPAIIEQLKKMGYSIQLGDRTSGPINAIYFDQQHRTLWGGSSNNGEDYGIGW